jgi:putative tricarboxylic transport membrane protein
MSAMGSFIGGTLSLIGLLFLVFPLAQAALQFGPPEFFAIISGSMVLLIYLSRGSAGKAFVMILVGLLLGTVGIDSISGIARFDFGSPYLLDGIDFIPLAMGLFGISEVLINLEETIERTVFESKLKNLLPNLEDWKRSLGPILRGTVIGFFGGILPGAGPVTATFLSYTIEKKISKDPGRFGQGAIEGVAGPETANNAATGGSFVPVLALGIPPNVIMAFLMGALIIHGVAPGPLLISQHPQIFWGVIASMYVGNCLLLLLNLPLIGFWVKILKIPYRILMPMILLFCIIGSYSINNNTLDVMVMVLFGVVGYILRKFDYEAAPLMVAYILGPMLERAFRKSLVLSDGKLNIFMERRIAAVILVISALLLVHTGYSAYRKFKSKGVSRQKA